MIYVVAAVLGVLQGLTEFLPISSTAHLLITSQLIGFPVIALGALASVWGAQKVGSAFGLSDLVTGLFVIGFLCALPEAYSAWRFTREGKTTVAISTATADGIVSLTIALLPPALVGTQVGDLPISTSSTLPSWRVCW